MLKMSMFTITKKFGEAIGLINSLEAKRFPLLLKRIIGKVHVRSSSTFTEAEQQQLQSLLSLNPVQLSTVLEACSYIFEKAIYENAKLKNLEASLVAAGLDPSRVAVFLQVWQANAAQVTNAMKKNTIAGPQVMSHFAWKTSMHMAQSSTAKLKEQSAIFDFALQSADGAEGREESFAIEFSHAQLYDFFLSLERIQAQLDSLGGDT